MPPIDGYRAQPSSAPRWRAAALAELLAALERGGIAYCLLGQVDSYPDNIPSDVDFMVHPTDLPRIAGVIEEVAGRIDARVVQRLRHEIGAEYFVLAAFVDARAVFVEFDVCGDYRRRTRLWLPAATVLASRERDRRGYLVPAAPMALLYYLIKRIDKRSLGADHLDYLRRTYARDPEGAAALLRQYLGERLSPSFEALLAESNPPPTAAALGRLAADLARAMPRERWVSRLRALHNELNRIVLRVLRPTGLVIGVLGADGSGKSTLIEHLIDEVKPAFRGHAYFHLRPTVLLRRSAAAAASATAPHDQVARSRAASLVKLGLLVFEYTAGWWLRIRPLIIRSTFVVFDRYLHDMIADPKRYRWAGGTGAIRAAAAWVPQPQLWLVLDAPVETLQARKQEVSAEASAMQRAAYLELAKRLRRCTVISTAGTVAEATEKAAAAVLDALALRHGHADRDRNGGAAVAPTGTPASR